MKKKKKKLRREQKYQHIISLPFSSFSFLFGEVQFTHRRREELRNHRERRERTFINYKETKTFTALKHHHRLHSHPHHYRMWNLWWNGPTLFCPNFFTATRWSCDCFSCDLLWAFWCIFLCASNRAPFSDRYCGLRRCELLKRIIMEWNLAFFSFIKFRFFVSNPSLIWNFLSAASTTFFFQVIVDIRNWGLVVGWLELVNRHKLSGCQMRYSPWMGA